MLQSLGRYDTMAPLKTTVSVVLPMLGRRATPIERPGLNTLPGIFLEFKFDGLSDHWVYTQIATSHEWILDKLGLVAMALT